MKTYRFLISVILFTLIFSFSVNAEQNTELTLPVSTEVVQENGKSNQNNSQNKINWAFDLMEKISNLIHGEPDQKHTSSETIISLENTIETEQGDTYIVRPVAQQTEVPASETAEDPLAKEIEDAIKRIDKMHEQQNQGIVFPEPVVSVPTPVIVQPTPQPTKISRDDLFKEKLKKHYADYYFVIESSLRYMEYNIEGYNDAICHDSRSMISYYRSGFASAILDIDVLMDKLGLYNDLDIWSLYRYLLETPFCGLYHDGLVKIKTAMDRLHYQTEHLGLWVPSTGRSESQMNRANCPQGFFTAPNGACLSEKGVRETKFWHSNGYPMICDYTGSCNETDPINLDRCDWQICN